MSDIPVSGIFFVSSVTKVIKMYIQNNKPKNHK